MAEQYLKVRRIETWPDGSVVLVLANNAYVMVKRMRDSGFTILNVTQLKELRLTAEGAHSIDVENIPNVGSVAF